MDRLSVIIIGGGAAGFFAAISCAEKHPDARVTIIEQARAALGKVRICGGGRCNVTHACFDPARLVSFYPRGRRELLGAFHRFQPADTLEWFERRGVKLKTEPDGRVFPDSDRSETITGCLQEAARQAGVLTRTGVGAASLTQQPDRMFQIHLKNGETLEANRVLLATGGGPLPMSWARDLGHRIAAPVPSLFTFTVHDNRLKELAGVSVPEARLELPGLHLTETGPLLITHWGLSGPAVLKLSAWGARPLAERGYHAGLRVNWVPGETIETAAAQMVALRNRPDRSRTINRSLFGLPHRLWERLVEAVHVGEKRWAELSNAEIQRLAGELTAGEYQIQGKGAFKEEFVTCGGVVLEEIDFRRMKSKVCPGLFLAGEILDIDALTGGFNLQAAWTTGWIAGQALGDPSC